MEKIKGSRRFFYNFSSMGHALLYNLVMVFFFIFFLPPAEKVAEGMIPFIPEKFFGFIPVAGLIFVFGRIIDGVADPVVASISDRSKTTIGRRKIFMLISGVPLGICTFLIFFPPVLTVSWVNVLFLFAVVNLFFILYTMYVAPYIALIPEMGHTEKERLNFTTVQAYFGLFGGILAMVAAPVVLGLFMESGIVKAHQIMIALFSLLGIVFLYTAVFAVDEKRFSNAKPSNIPLIQSLKLTLKNRSFLIFLITNTCLWYVFNLLQISVLHISITMMELTESTSFTNFVALFGVALIFFVVVRKIVDKIGKKKMLLIGLAAFAICNFLISITGLLPGNPNIYGKIIFGLIGIPVAIFLVLPNVFISELCDTDYKKTGERREAMYFGVNGFFTKIGIALSAGLASWFYVLFGKDIANPLGIRLSLILGGMIAIVGFIIFRKYPEKKVKGIIQ